MRINVKCICLCHETVLLFSMSCDWETVKNVVPGNSSIKPDQTGGDGKGMKQSEMFNYSVYSRLGNNKKCLISLYHNVVSLRTRYYSLADFDQICIKLHFS